MQQAWLPIKRIFVVLFSVLILLSGCASEPRIVVNQNSILDQKKFEQDQAECIEVARNYELSGEKAGKAVAGAVIGGTAVAGIATAVAGAVFAPAIPFIIAGAVAGGGLWGASVSKEEAKARESILIQCLQSRGYEVYAPNS